MKNFKSYLKELTIVTIGVLIAYLLAKEKIPILSIKHLQLKD
jgi:hypothetical protein